MSKSIWLLILLCAFANLGGESSEMQPRSPPCQSWACAGTALRAGQIALHTTTNGWRGHEDVLIALNLRGGGKTPRQIKRTQSKGIVKQSRGGSTAVDELAEAKERLVKAESEVDAVKDVLRKTEEAVPVDAQRVAEAKLGVAKAELGVAKAELGVAEAKWQAALGDEKAVFLSSINTALKSLETAQESVRTANMAYEKALNATTATPLQGAAGGAQAASGQDLLQNLQELKLGIAEIKEQQQQSNNNIAEIKEQQQEMKKQLSDGPMSSATCATLGHQVYTSLMATNNWTPHCNADAEGDPVLSSALENELDSSKFKGESDLIRWLTPHLKTLVKEAADGLDMNLVLVNTERHAYFVDPHNGAASKPDMLVTHPSFYKYVQSPADTEYSEEGFVSGIGADWRLRDCWEVFFEIKLEIRDSVFRALGEGLEYARRKVHVFNNERGIAEDESGRCLTRLVLCDSKCFYLVACYGNDAKKCVYGFWTANGSRKAVVDFLQRGFSQTDLPRLWLTAMRTLCDKFEVDLVEPSEANPSCFLGGGLTGRVFLVKSRHSSELCGLKVCLGDVACSQIREEKSKFDEFRSHLGAAENSVIRILRRHESPDRSFAGILVEPVGQVLPRTQAAIMAAVGGLKVLAEAGFGHGDARTANAVWLPKTDAPATKTSRCIWVDLRTLYRWSDCSLTKEIAFVRDVQDFYDSLFPSAQRMNVETAAESYLQDPADQSIWELFKSAWAKQA